MDTEVAQLALAEDQPLLVEDSEILVRNFDLVGELRSILDRVSVLPRTLCSVPFDRIDERIISQSFFDLITTQAPPKNNEPDWELRLHRRKESLAPYVGKTLCSVFLRLPGQHLTVEVDRIQGKVIHWEWQRD